MNNYPVSILTEAVSIDPQTGQYFYHRRESVDSSMSRLEHDSLHPTKSTGDTNADVD